MLHLDNDQTNVPIITDSKQCRDTEAVSLTGCEFIIIYSLCTFFLSKAPDSVHPAQPSQRDFPHRCRLWLSHSGTKSKSKSGFL